MEKVVSMMRSAHIGALSETQKEGRKQNTNRKVPVGGVLGGFGDTKGENWTEGQESSLNRSGPKINANDFNTILGIKRYETPGQLGNLWIGELNGNPMVQNTEKWIEMQDAFEDFRAFASNMQFPPTAPSQVILKFLETVSRTDGAEFTLGIHMPKYANELPDPYGPSPFSSVIGLDETVSEIINQIDTSISPSGRNAGKILLWGPPGTGKTYILEKAKKYIMWSLLRQAKQMIPGQLPKNTPFFRCLDLDSTTVADSYQGGPQQHMGNWFDMFYGRMDVIGRNKDLGLLVGPVQYPADRYAIAFLDEIDQFLVENRDATVKGGDESKAEVTRIWMGQINSLDQQFYYDNDGQQVKNPNFMHFAATNYPWRLDTAVQSRMPNRIFLGYISMESITALFEKTVRDALNIFMPQSAQIKDMVTGRILHDIKKMIILPEPQLGFPQCLFGSSNRVYDQFVKRSIYASLQNIESYITYTVQSKDQEYKPDPTDREFTFDKEEYKKWSVEQQLAKVRKTDEKYPLNIGIEAYSEEAMEFVGDVKTFVEVAQFGDTTVYVPPEEPTVEEKKKIIDETLAKSKFGSLNNPVAVPQDKGTNLYSKRQLEQSYAMLVDRESFLKYLFSTKAIWTDLMYSIGSAIKRAQSDSASNSNMTDWFIYKQLGEEVKVIRAQLSIKTSTPIPMSIRLVMDRLREGINDDTDVYSLVNFAFKELSKISVAERWTGWLNMERLWEAEDDTLMVDTVPLGSSSIFNRQSLSSYINARVLRSDRPAYEILSNWKQTLDAGAQKRPRVEGSEPLTLKSGKIYRLLAYCDFVNAQSPDKKPNLLTAEDLELIYA